MTHEGCSIRLHQPTRDGRLWVRLISRQAFRQYMQYRGETNESLGKKARVSKAIVGHLRSGQRSTCRGDTARAIAEALNAPVDALFVAELPQATRSTTSGTAA